MPTFPQSRVPGQAEAATAHQPTQLTDAAVITLSQQNGGKGP